MKYAIVKCTDTNFAIHGEYPTIEAAKIAFHQFSAALWNDPSTAKATMTAASSPRMKVLKLMC